MSALLANGWATSLSFESTGEAETDRALRANTAMEQRLNNMIDWLADRLILWKVRVILKTVLMKMVLFLKGSLRVYIGVGVLRVKLVGASNPFALLSPSLQCLNTASFSYPTNTVRRLHHDRRRLHPLVPEF